MLGKKRIELGIVLSLALLAGCIDSAGRSDNFAATSCMQCHNGGQDNDYAGPGIENPHPFGNANRLGCQVCHGGNPQGADKLASHVPAPPEIGDRQNWINDREAYFNRLTQTGIDKYPDYQVNGRTWTALEYLQFINPGDLRVVTLGRSCGQCHAPHADVVSKSLLATEAGILSGAMYAIGVDNQIPAHQGLFEDTAVDLGFRAVVDGNFQLDTNDIGVVGRLLEYPVFSVRNQSGPDQLFNNPLYDSNTLPSDQLADGTVITDSRLANLYHEQIAFTCGDCHLGSAGANNRYGDFRSSGCSACHMPYSLDGRSRSGDPNINLNEPFDPDDIDEPELPHLRRHRIHGVARTLPGGNDVPGIDDYTCAGCHQGSNRTVMQYWGIRLDQNEDLRRGVQYPAQPFDYDDTTGDTRLFDPAVGNQTFNGRDRRQYIRFEDYDDDDRDDTPPDVHYEAGMGCIDCHGSHDLHGGDVASGDGKIKSRMEQSVAIRCESCHGSVEAYAATTPGQDYGNQPADLALDAAGNPLRHVARDGQGDFYLTSRLTGNVHYVPQTRDTVWDNGKVDPFTQQAVFSERASYAMGRNDGDSTTGTGPKQGAGAATGFKHGDNMTCASCHSSWTNSCVGCHLEGEYNGGNNFSNITGQRIVFRERNADFVYQSPVLFQLGVDENDLVDPIAANTDTFFKYRDRNGVFSDVFAFTDRNGGGANTARSAFPSLSHNFIMPHSIRGKVDAQNEGPRYCVACHLTDSVQVPATRATYDAFRQALQNDDFAWFDVNRFDMLRTEIGLNPGNQRNSPYWVHMVAGLGSGLFLFDEDGCPVNLLDNDTQRKGCNNQSPASQFNPANVAYNLDRIVDETGRSTGSNSHPTTDPVGGATQRTGADNARLAGPLGQDLIRRLTDPDTGIVLDSYLDADGQVQGGASTWVTGP